MKHFLCCMVILICLVIMRQYKILLLQSQEMGLMTVFHNEGKWDNSNVEFADGKIIAYDKQNRTPRMHILIMVWKFLTRQAFDIVPDNEPYDLVPVYQALVTKTSAGCA